MSLDGGNNAVTDELKAQVRELQEMMRVMMEDRRPAFGYLFDLRPHHQGTCMPQARYLFRMSAALYRQNMTVLISPNMYCGRGNSFHTSSNRDVGTLYTILRARYGWVWRMPWS